jgi:hypothetical protein
VCVCVCVCVDLHAYCVFVRDNLSSFVVLELSTQEFASALFAVTVNVQDASSGVRRCTISFQALSFTQTFSASTTNNPLSTVLAIPVTLARFSTTGDWTISTLVCFDATERSITYNTTTLAAMFPSTRLFVTQTGPGDSQPPSIINFSFTPVNVNTRFVSRRFVRSLLDWDRRIRCNRNGWMHVCICMYVCMYEDVFLYLFFQHRSTVSTLSSPSAHLLMPTVAPHPPRSFFKQRFWMISAASRPAVSACAGRTVRA